MKASVRDTLSIRRKIACTLFLPLFALALVASLPVLIVAQGFINAANVHKVDFSKGGRMLGSYTEVRRGAWDEQDPRGVASFHFVETRRDASAIYLFDSQRRMNIKLDLQREKIVFSYATGGWRDLYDIMPKPPPDRQPERHEARRSEVTGYNVLWFKAGSNGRGLFTYAKAGEQAWDELDARGEPVHRYRVTGQSQETLTLFDHTRNLTLELDFRRRTSLSTIPGRTHQNMYDIVFASNEEMPDNRGGYDR